MAAMCGSGADGFYLLELCSFSAVRARTATHACAGPRITLGTAHYCTLIDWRGGCAPWETPEKLTASTRRRNSIWGTSSVSACACINLTHKSSRVAAEKIEIE